ncbi:uncharacterized protein LOC108682420 [Hyalella azteca]|uniref:Uncharacterized protein LOC108682420 n=1 Tax=Hyalella azteca TaxID=294128 RepID=A0A8B7PM49_HYAAZ|nr:uncharacterized protein LOC108682420 [Hyalella azteca]
MATSTLVCGVCSEEFDTYNHKPLCLTCGHTFCFSCVASLIKVAETRNCPTCRQQISEPADRILVNYALIPSGSQPCKRKRPYECEEACPHQGKDLHYLCVDCIEPLCFACTRDTHAKHRIELLEDLVRADDIDFRDKIRLKLNEKLASMNNIVSACNDTLKLIEKIVHLKTDVEGWRDLLLVNIASTEKDLQAWDDLAASADANKTQENKEIISRLKLMPEGSMKLMEIKTQLDAASKTCDSLKSPIAPHELMPAGRPWTVADYGEGERALASLYNKRKPSHLMVVSTHTSPIPRLGELLTRLTAHDTGDISLLPLDSFWRPAGQTDEDLGTINKEFGHRINAVYGSPDQILAHLNARSLDHRGLGVRLASVKDVERCAELPPPIFEVCCLQEVPNSTGTFLKSLGWNIGRWHFPDLSDADLGWMSKILSIVDNNTYRNNSVHLVLPRDRLTSYGGQQLLEIMKKRDVQIDRVYCEPRSELHTTRNSNNVAIIELSTISIIQWIPKPQNS